MTDRERIEAWLDSGGVPSTDIERRLIRRLPWVQQALSGVSHDRIDAAMMGLSPAPTATGTLTDRVRSAQAGAVLGVHELAELEAEAQAEDEPHLWVSAARLHALASPEREASARRALSAQELPYVFPGELDAMMIDVLAAGEKVLPALHVDWIRKLTDWIAPALAQDCKSLGLWFWPVLRSLDSGRLGRPLDRLAATDMSPGGKGTVVIYAERLGVDLPSLTSPMCALDERIASLARLAVSQH